MDQEITQHPSFGIISLNAPWGGGPKKGGKILFGSPTGHHRWITILISQGEHIRSLHHDNYHPNGQIIEIAMSEAQFARFVASTGQGCGVPCTIQWTKQDGQIEQPPDVHPRQTFEDEIKRELKKTSGKLKEAQDTLEEMSQKPRVTKTELNDALKLVAAARQNIEHNIPWIRRVFEEFMDKTAEEVKIDIESFTSNCIRQMGSQEVSKMPELEIK